MSESNSTSSPTSVLLLGEYNVGKTHYGAQLLRRLNGQAGALRMRAAASNLKAFEEALKKIDNGLAAEHTATDYAADSHWPIGDGHRSLDLVWPEYGGEQLNGILVNRQVPTAWHDRARVSDGWLVLVRANNSENGDDFLTRPLSDLRKAPEQKPPYRHTSQARIIELLQMLLFVRGSDVINAKLLPTICIVLTCWDELPSELTAEAPHEVLRNTMPMVAQYVDAIWPEARRSVLGLSALERALNDKVPDEEFLDRGPENFGYVVTGKGERTKDLSVPLARIAGWQ